MIFHFKHEILICITAFFYLFCFQQRNSLILHCEFHNGHEYREHLARAWPFWSLKVKEISLVFFSTSGHIKQNECIYSDIEHENHLQK